MFRQKIGLHYAHNSIGYKDRSWNRQPLVITAMPTTPDVAQPQLEVDVVADRRRPGRRDDVRPELIPLLRGVSPDTGAADEQCDDSDQLEDSDLRVAKGLAIGILISLFAFWIPIGVAVYYLQRR